jgi:hypothetical protein
MAIGFDARSVDALVVHGYPFEGLSHAQCATLQDAISRIGSGLVAVPNGDLSETSNAAAAPDAPVAFSFVVGALIARAGTAAVEDATTQSASVSDTLAERAAASFEAARPLLDPLLEAQGVTPGIPGLFLIAAGPLASAYLEGDPQAALRRLRGEGDTEELLTSLAVRHTADSEVVRITLKGQFTLSARYR